MSRWLVLALLAGSLEIGAQSAERVLFNEAESRYAGDNFAFALEAYEQFIEEYPLSERLPDAHYRRGVSLFRLGRLQTAVSTFQLIQRRYRTTRFIEFVPFWEGVALYQLGEHRAAALTLADFVANSPDPSLQAQAFLYKGLAEFATGRTQEAVTSLRELRGLAAATTADFAAYGTVLLGHILLGVGSYEQVVALVTETPPESVPEQWQNHLRFYRAESFWRLGQTAAAALDYRKLTTAQNEISIIALTRLFSSAQQGGDFGAMQRVSQEAEQRFASSPVVLNDFWLRLGVASYERHSLDVAELFLSRVWERPDVSVSSEIASLYLAETYIEARDLTAAREVLTRAAERSGLVGESAVIRLGDLAALQQQWLEAAGHYRAMTRRFPDSARASEVHYLLGYAEYRAANLEVALTELEEVHPNTIYWMDTLRLRILLLKRLGRIDAALVVSDQFVRLFPENLTGQVDRQKLLFAAGRYPELITKTQALLQQQPGLEADSPREFLLLRHLLGLALVSGKDYTAGAQALASVTTEATRAAGLPEIAPFGLYYRGWALYRAGQFELAAGLLDSLLLQHPAHPVRNEALYLTGWVRFTLGQPQAALNLLSQVNQQPDVGLAARAAYLAGKAHQNLENWQSAIGWFQQALETDSSAAVSDDALFELAESLVQLQDLAAAADAFLRLANEYPGSPLQADALYRRAEVLLEAGQHELAGDAYYDYRQAHPRGGLVDAALFWGAVAAQKASEVFAAVFLWENLIERFPQSTFHSEAQRLTGELYAAQGDYSTALKYFANLVAQHPVEAAEIGASRRAEEIRFLLLGLTDKEAELSAIISSEGAAGTKAGRDAMLELARLYIFDDSAPIDLAFQMLQEVVGTDDAVTTARGRFLLGEYYFRRGNPTSAAAEFLLAALANPQDRDQVAAALFRAAQVSKEAGDVVQARDLANRLVESFSGTVWVDRAKSLIGDLE